MGMAKRLTRDDILSAHDVTTAEVQVPEWDGFVTIRSLSALERDTFEESLIKESKKGRKTTRKAQMKGARAKLVVRTVVIPQEDTSPETWPLMFSDKDIDALNSKNGKAVDRIFDKASELCGIGEDDLEEALGNSETDPSDDASGE